MSWLSEFKFSPFIRITEKSGDSWPPSDGVYILAGLTTEIGDPLPAAIDRICGQDANGVLYLGEGKSVAGRLGEIVGSLLKGTDKSDAARRYHHSIKLRERFPLNKLAIAWCSTDPPAWKSEERLMKAYVDEFGERPPLNAQGGAVLSG
jgi:hypothetical protein